MIIEINLQGEVVTCAKNGNALKGKALRDLLDCAGSGEQTENCLYILEKYKPEFRIVRQVNGKYENCIASQEEKKAACEAIYFESDSDFGNEKTAEMYLVWQAAANEVEDH